MLKHKIDIRNYYSRIYIFFYKIYLIIKFFKKKTTYSQWKEDTFIKKFFYNKKKGDYLDIGCFHPFKYSNTALLYKKGWTGVNLDINPLSIELFNLVRKKDKNLCIAISNKRGKVNCHFHHFFSPINSFDSGFKKKRLLYKVGNKYFVFKFNKRVIVNTCKFHDIVKKKYDFFNLDIEGGEYDVLKQIDFKIFSPKLICIEIHGNINLAKNKKIKDILIKNNYRFAKRFGPSCLFVKKNNE